jgi:hypothetical protein
VLPLLEDSFLPLGVLVVMDSRLNFSNRPTIQEEQVLYTHLLKCVEVEPPSRLINRFYHLFINGVDYPDPYVRRALERIVASDSAEQGFKFILNRSCYILINRWLSHPQLQSAVADLMALFEAKPEGLAVSKTTWRLRQLVQCFTQTQQYIVLYRLAQVMKETGECSSNASAKPLGSLIRRYPCIYEHCILTSDSTDEQRHKVRLIRDRRQRQMEIDLSKYLTYQQLQHSRTLCEDKANFNNSSLSQKEVQPVNPTLLSDRQLDSALKHFTGKVEGSNTYHDSAQQFLTYSRWTSCYRTFKDELYEHLTASVDPSYGKYQFNRQLYQQLQNSLPQHNEQELNDALLLRTCRKLVDFLVVESSQRPNHYIFSDLTSNLGVTPTIGLLLKIVLLCRQVKCHLEKRFSILFSHYETHSKEEVGWLVESLENLNVAFSTHFGTMSLCS